MYLMYNKEYQGNKYASRELLSKAIECYCNIMGILLPPKVNGNFEVKTSSKGKPYIEDFSEFSISHTENLWCVIFANHKCGFDVERAKKGNLEKMAARSFDKYDALKVSELGEKAFFKLWCRKEAYIKAIDESIFTDVKGLWSEDDSVSIDGFYIRDLKIFDGYFSAICVTDSEQDLDIVKVKV